jgi:hypothetical protein
MEMVSWNTFYPNNLMLINTLEGNEVLTAVKVRLLFFWVMSRLK